MALKLITFDITGTLLLLTEPVGYHYSKAASRHGINAPADALTKHFYSEFKKLVIEHPNFGERTGIGWQAWWHKLVFRVFEGALPDVNLLESSMNNISSDLIEVFKTKECWKLADGAEQLLYGLKNRKLNLGVISNYDPRLHDILDDLSIKKYFQFITTSYEAKCLKPHPGIFNAAIGTKAELEKSEILHIGDNQELDFFGARNVGWNALLVSKEFAPSNEKFAGIDEKWVVKNIQDIYQKLEDLKLL